MRRLAAILLACSAPAIAQPISAGIVGGIPVSDAFETFRGNSGSYFTHTNRYLVGPTVSFQLPARLSLEVDALYRRLGYQFEQSVGSNRIITSTVANSWEFPILLDWEIVPGPVRPFVSAGASVRNISGIRQVRVGLGDYRESDGAVEFAKRNDIGFVFGAGVAFKAGPVRISPQLRYTRWGSEVFRQPLEALLRTNRNQGDFLLSLTF